MGGVKTLGSGGKLLGPRALRSGPRSPRSGMGGGGLRGLRSGGKPREGLPRSGGGGSQIVSGRFDLPRRGQGGRVFPGRLDPQWTGWGSIHVRMTRLHTKTEGGASRQGMTRPPERLGASRESKPWEPPQYLVPDVERKDADGEEGTRTHPPPDPQGSRRPMVETARRHGARRGDRTLRRRWGRRSETAARGTRKHTPPARLRMRQWEAQSPRGLRQPRRKATTALGTQQHKPLARLWLHW